MSTIVFGGNEDGNKRNRTLSDPELRPSQKTRNDHDDAMDAVSDLPASSASLLQRQQGEVNAPRPPIARAVSEAPRIAPSRAPSASVPPKASRRAQSDAPRTLQATEPMSYVNFQGLRVDHYEKVPFTSDDTVIVLGTSDNAIVTMPKEMVEEFKTLVDMMEGEYNPGTVLKVPNVSKRDLDIMMAFAKKYGSYRERVLPTDADYADDAYLKWKFVDGKMHKVTDGAKDEDPEYASFVRPARQRHLDAAAFFKKPDSDDLQDGFTDVDLWGTLNAANFMAFDDCMHAGCAAVALIMKGKTPDQIRARFNIDDDFTVEEKAAIERENAWALGS